MVDITNLSIGRDKENAKKMYVILQNHFSVSYDDLNQVFENNERIEEHGTDYKDLINKYKKDFYNTFLKRNYRHIVVLAAAGTSMNNGEKDKCGKCREKLWEECKVEIDALINEMSELKTRKFYNDKDIENLLSHIMLYEKLNCEIKNKDEESLRAKLEAKISNACKLALQPEAPHKDFLNKITARKNNDTRVQIFTTNYDTLFEQAANEGGFVVIDGFSFTHPRSFSGKWFDLDIVNRERTRLKQEESFVSKVFHLYKLHGSLNWAKVKEIILQSDNPEKPLIIYPANEKYESSYEQPYFEMMSRFQQALRKEETLLIVIGFGFKDKHIKNVILEAVEQNPSFQLLIVYFNDRNEIASDGLEDFFINKADFKVKRKVNIIFDSFADFTANYPENQSYLYDNNKDETV